MGIEHLKVEEIFSLLPAAKEKDRELIQFYAHTFAQPSEENECLECGERLGGMMGSFRWGICHGEGICSNCGWPARAYHNPKTKEGEEVTGFFECILQYHPDFVTKNDPKQ